jgi:alpha-tubulin suppressor-like RCC1 family protein
MRVFAVVLTAALCLPACDPVGPGPVSRAGGFFAVAAGGVHSCGLTMQGSAFCWGGNAHGQLGSGTHDGAARPVRVASDIAFAVISAGDRHSCALDTGGGVYCWGANDRGQLGTGTRGDASAPVAVAPTLRFMQVSAGSEHTCAITLEGQAFCWGAGANGRTGSLDEADVLEPQEVPGVHPIRAIAAGGRHSCAVDTGGTAICWGANEMGQLGDSTNVGRSTPAPVFGASRYRMLTAGWAHTCALLEDGRANCWGSNAHGELGEGVPPYEGFMGAWVPYRVQGDLQASVITAGRYVSCMVVMDNALPTRDKMAGRHAWCWGAGGEGQLGTGSIRDYHVAHRVYDGDLSASSLRFAGISAGTHHVCGVSDARAIFCWGRGWSGQLGDGKMTGSVLPVRVVDGG